ncbi:DUF4352 domain-containing protein [Streptomyces sp. PTM05]|uniref:DUF4352 domain-containing protein n=1 Tax=Streptantibioticus parmotrematis TaxID=2873249 RepID=A0ABS7R0B9_9ACTN|nr:DUF4352 domain-containing protein [Streptantibioticus parmotrematis]MBY8888912.1 DUF4352 domain-containing protein [Streptantibioticus parmotrematis]
MPDASHTPASELPVSGTPETPEAATTSSRYAAWLRPAPRDGAGLAALVLGAGATLAAVTLHGVVLGLPLGIPAIVAGLVGRRRARRGEAGNGRQALAGAALGAAAVGLSLVVIATAATSSGDRWFGGAQVPLTSGRGTYDRPLGPGGTAAFGDGTRVTVGAPRRFTPPAGSDGYTPGDVAYRFTVTVRATGGADLDLGDYTYFATAGDASTDLELISTDAADFPGTLKAGGSATVVFAFDVPRGLTGLDFDFEPTGEHDDAYWRLA